MKLAELTNQAHAESRGRDEVAVRLGNRPERVLMDLDGQPTDVNEIRLYIR